MDKLKLIGWMTLVAAVLDIGIDALNGSGFDFQSHIVAIAAALAGVGLIAASKAVASVK